jgi:hypothetical protein
MKGLNVKQITGTAVPITAGAVGAKFLKNVSSKFIQNDKLRAAAPLVLGLLLSGSKKTEKIGFGMIAVGGADLIGAFIPALSGIEDLDLSGVFGDDLTGTLNDDLSGYDVGDIDGLDVGSTLNGFDDMNGYGEY